MCIFAHKTLPNKYFYGLPDRSDFHNELKYVSCRFLSQSWYLSLVPGCQTLITHPNNSKDGKKSPGVEIFFVGAVVTDNMSRWCYLCAVKMIKRNHNLFSFSIAIKISWFKLWSNVHTTKDQDLRQFLFYYWPVSGFKRKYFVLQIENADSKDTNI